jgi:hypothetical protein
MRKKLIERAENNIMIALSIAVLYVVALGIVLTVLTLNLAK